MPLEDNLDVHVNDARFKIMADVAPVMIWMAGLDKLCNFFNHSWLEFTGRAMEEEVGYGWAEGLHPDEMSKCLDIYNTSFDARADFRMEYRLRRHDGEYRWILDAGRPIITADGAFMGFIGSCIDITDLKLTEEKNHRLQEEVYQIQKMEAIGSLASGIAHDMKNLMAIIEGNAEIIMEITEEGSKQREYAAHLMAASTRASEMLQKLLLFSRKQPLAKAKLDYGLVIIEMSDLVQRLMPKNISIDFERPHDLWPVNADKGLLEQVLVNLMTNARDAMPNGGKMTISMANVCVSEEDVTSNPRAKAGSFVVLRVEDTGKGMTPEEMDRIFEPFYTTKATGNGTGLGLSTVYGIVKEHGGWIKVESQVGVGSAFHIYIPAELR